MNKSVQHVRAWPHTWRMHSDQSLNTFAFDQIRLALVGLIGLTGAHLGVPLLSRAVFKQARQTLAGLEALLRRLLLLMALELEHEISPSTGETSGILRERSPARSASGRSFSPFQPQRNRLMPDFAALPMRDRRAPLPLAAPIIARIEALQNLLKDPDARARRMAFHLARQRADQYALLPWTDVNLRRLGTELSTLYPLLGVSITEAIRARPPRAGPRPRPPPRIRQL